MAKILLIEDEGEIRELLMDELAAQGHHVIEASNAPDGLEYFLEEAPDLVLCDRAMSGMSGYELLERIRNDYPQHDHVPFVYLTALTDPRDRGAVDHLRPSAYIGKPIDFIKLKEKINELLEVKRA